MKEKLPTFREYLYILRTLPLKEKTVFVALSFLFILGVLGVLWKLDNRFLTDTPSAGGSLVEGIIGTPRFINPVLASSDADRDLVGLVYSGLMRPDNRGGLELDLAESYKISDDGLTYTFTLKPKLLWSDKKPLTADDIVFTVEEAKDPNVKSPRRASWEGVAIEKIDERVVVFTLKKPYAPFLENTTIGILPKHIWEDASSEQMIFSEFNVNPVGSGPYKVKNIRRNNSGIANSYTLARNKYFALNAPYLKEIILKFYPSEEAVVEAYKLGAVTSVGGISSRSAEIAGENSTNMKTLFLPRVFAVFFNQSNNPALAYKEVREALDLATDKNKIIQDVLGGYAVGLHYPIPPGTFGSIVEDKATRRDHAPDVEGAKRKLEAAGWKYNEEDKVYEKTIKKEKVKLEFALATSDVQELKAAADELTAMWNAIGAKVRINIFETGDLNQNIIRSRKYDALLFGIVVGRDPDPFAFWHSSQRNDPGLNIASYANIKVDKILEEARGTGANEKRESLYQDFEREVVKDTPAIFLFSPQFIYVLPKHMRSTVDIESITVPSERFSQIHTWYTESDKIWKIFTN